MGFDKTCTWSWAVKEISLLTKGFWVNRRTAVKPESRQLTQGQRVVQEKEIAPEKQAEEPERNNNKAKQNQTKK